MSLRIGSAAAIAVAAAAALTLPAAAARAEGIAAKPVFGEKLPNVPGKTLTAVVVDFAPGATDTAHRHAGSVFVYVLEGAIRSQVSGDGPARVYRAGETFFEPPGSTHLVGENASATEPARILAVFVADDGATLTSRRGGDATGR